MEAHCRISIITPVYNGMPYLRECVESVLSQNFHDWEMLISDNGSTDGSRVYLDTITDKRIHVFKQEANLGIFGNLNFLFKKAKAPISQILCADDYFISNDSLLTVHKYWKNQPDKLGFVRFNHMSESGKGLLNFQVEFLPDVVLCKSATLLFFIFGNIPGNLSNVSLRTELISRAGPFRTDLPYAGDFEYWVRAAKISDMGIRGERVVYVRRHEKTASVMLNRDGDLVPQLFQIVDTLFMELREKALIHSFWLRLHAVLHYDCLHRDVALRNWLSGKSAYLKQLERSSGAVVHSFPNVVRWILFFLSFGGRVGRVWLAKVILGRII